MKYNSIQVLRCLAVLSVVFLHSKFVLRQNLLHVPFFSDFGWIGVRLFFVISGFIIAERIGTQRRLGAYLIRRYMRVFPLYVLVSAAALAISNLAGSNIFSFRRTDSGAAFVDESVYWKLKSLLIYPQDQWPVLMVGWSLEYEVVFYLAFGISYFLLGRRGALAAMLVLSLVGTMYPAITRPFLDPFFIYFLFGCATCEAIRTENQFIRLCAPFVFLLSAPIWILHLYHVINITNLGFIVCSATCFSALIIFVIDLEKKRKAFFEENLAVLIGNMSFSVYLLHWFIFPLISYLTYTIVFDALLAELIRITAVVAALMASWATWKFVERPVGRLINRWIENRYAAMSPR